LFKTRPQPAPRRSPPPGLGLRSCPMVSTSHGWIIAIEDLPGWNASCVIRLAVHAG
jgi:hypothetical protein